MGILGILGECSELSSPLSLPPLYAGLSLLQAFRFSGSGLKFSSLPGSTVWSTPASRRPPSSPAGDPFPNARVPGSPGALLGLPLPGLLGRGSQAALWQPLSGPGRPLEPAGGELSPSPPGGAENRSQRLGSLADNFLFATPRSVSNFLFRPPGGADACALK